MSSDILNKSTCRIFNSSNILLSFDSNDLFKSSNAEYSFVWNNFCGHKIDFAFPNYDIDFVTKIIYDAKIIYLVGDIKHIVDELILTNISNMSIMNQIIDKLCVVENMSFNNVDKFDKFISSYQLPINIQNLGVYIRSAFNNDDYKQDMFSIVVSDHKFQELTESNKPSKSLRTGLYLSNVEKINMFNLENINAVKFNLMRCSTNFVGPTEAFTDNDVKIINYLNNLCDNYFVNHAKLNHVLVQMYNNDNKRKASIKEHSDKTEDMNLNGLIAFVSFYDIETLKNSYYSKYIKTDGVDIFYKKTSVFTTLHFKLKNVSKHSELPQFFDVKLYNNSCFIIPLRTNELYTHEIKPSTLSSDIIPVRIGYVVRCSDTVAININGDTHIFDKNNKIHKLLPPNENDVSNIKKSYLLQNTTDETINYDFMQFSLNNGDYICPL
jgi:hypothetical protein